MVAKNADVYPVKERLSEHTHAGSPTAVYSQTSKFPLYKNKYNNKYRINTMYGNIPTRNTTDF
jgi:hypothetical protein